MKKILAIALLFMIASSSIAFAGGQCPIAAKAEADAAAAQAQTPEDEAKDMNE